MQRLKNISLYTFLGLLAYMPLHIFLSTWLGSSFNILSFTKIFKDIVLLVGFFITFAVSVRQPWFRVLAKDKLIWLIMAYVLLTLGLAIFRPNERDAEVLGVVYNIRFLVFFGYAGLLAKLFNPRLLKKRVIITVLTSATAVLVFGVIQYTVLPNNALTHVGYTRANGVLPIFLIDDKPDLERVMSTLRDPNSLGSYIIIIGLLSLALLIRNRGRRQLSSGILVLSLLCLVFTFSRSAWLGFIVAATVVTLVEYRSLVLKINPHKLTYIAVGLLITAIFLWYPFRDTYFIKNVISHSDYSTVQEDPNQLRVRFFHESLQKIKGQPLGKGPGTAGLASIKNQSQGVNLTENYYLQIALEAGVLGLALFIAILSLVARRLLKLADSDALAMGLLASFAGLLVTNFLVHIWSNEAVAYTWWGLVGVVVWGSPPAGKVGIIGANKRTLREDQWQELH